MNRYLVELRTLCDWQSRLGDPEVHWKRGASAMELAVAWTLASVSTKSGLPANVEQTLQVIQDIGRCQVRLAVPELRTPLPGGSTRSQTDLWVLLATDSGLVSLSVEGKAEESFAEVTSAWLKDDRHGGKERRLTYLCQELHLERAEALPLRYQLLHRTVAAMIEAREWEAKAAVMLVQRFSPDLRKQAKSWEDYAKFISYLGVQAEANTLQVTKLRSPMPLWVGWLDCECASDEVILSVLGQSRASLSSQISRSHRRSEVGNQEPEEGDAVAD